MCAMGLTLGPRGHCWHRRTAALGNGVLLSPLPAWVLHLPLSLCTRPRGYLRAVGQTQVCAPAFAAKAAGKASPGPGFHSGKQLSLSLKLTWWGVSQIVPGDSGVAWPLKITNLHYPPPHTHPNSRLPLCCSPSPPSHHSPHLITDLS